MSIESVISSNHLILCCPLLLLPSIFPNIRVFSHESALRIRWPKYWSFSFNIRPSNEHPSFRMFWLGLLAVQGTLKSLLQHHSSKASILLCSTFFIVQLSHPYMTTGKTIALTRWNFVGKVMSLLFNMLSRSVITFLPRSKCLLISSLQSPSAMIFGAQKTKIIASSPIFSLQIDKIESYDKPRQCIKRQRHLFADKGPYSQSYGFSSSHVWMWELDHKEGWVLKNRCFWIAVLDKTL